MRPVAFLAVPVGLISLVVACATGSEPPGSPSPDSGLPRVDEDSGAPPTDARLAALEAPTGLVATAGDGKVSLKWNSVSGATSYTIYRSTAVGTRGQVVGKSSAGDHVDSTVTNGTTYHYTVTAVSGDREGPSSAQVSATPQAAAPLPPTGLTATAGDGVVTLGWAQVSGLTYKVYRSTASGVQGALRTTSNVNDYTDRGVQNGTTYWYTVTAVRAGLEGAGSAQVSATPQRPPRLGLTIFVTAEKHNGDFANDPLLAGANAIQKADSFCMMSASKFYAAPYKAFMVDGILRDAVAMIDWVLKPSRAYYQNDGATLIGTTTAASIFDLAAGSLTNPWDSTAPLNNKYVWTGIGSNTWALDSSCMGWSVSASSSSGNMGVIGRLSSQAIGVGARSLCQNTQHMLCVEQ